MSPSPLSRRVVATFAGAALIAAASLVAASPALAVGTINVSSVTGSDEEGTGTVAAPYATIAKAVAVAVDGDTISVASGTYAGATVNKDVTIVGSGASNVTSLLSLVAGAEGATIATLHFTADTTQIRVDGLDGSPVTTIANNTFDLPANGPQSNSVEIGSGHGLQIVSNTFTGDGSGVNSASVNIIGEPTGLISDIGVIGNISTGYTNFFVAVGNGTAGIDGITITANEVSGATGSGAVYLSENLQNLDISGNYFHDNVNNGVRLTLYNGGSEATYDEIGPGIDISGNVFADNEGGIRVEEGTVDDDVTATGNVFLGNTSYGVSNESEATVVATGGSWSTGTPGSSGTDSVTSGVTFAPVAAEPPFTEPADSSTAAAHHFAGSSSSTLADVTTGQVGVSHANTWYAVWGYSTKTFLGWVKTSGSGQFQVTWPVSPLYGSHQLALLTVTGALAGFVSVTGAAETPYTITPPTPGISGTAKVGHVLTAIPRTWDAGVVLTYQWKADGVDLAGEDDTQLTLTPALAGKKITLAVTGTKVAYPTTTKLSPATAAVAKGDLDAVKPTVSGSHTVGATLTATAGVWGPGSVSLSYRWLRDGLSISGATLPTYKQQAADLGHIIQVKVTGSAAGYANKSSTSSAPSATKPKLVSLPSSISIPTVPAVGTKIHITKTGSFQSGAILTYAWKVGSSVVSTSSTFTPRASDLGKTVKVTVTAAKIGSTTATISSNTSSAVVAGTFTTAPLPSVTGAQVGSVSSVTLGTWSPKPTSYEYQWTLDGVDIAGAIKSTYTPTGASQGHQLGVKVKAVRGGFTSVTKTSASKLVQVGVFTTTTKPKITGTAKVGKVLTATVTGWSSSPQFAYQWKLNDVVIVGAIDKTYTVASEDLGGRLSVTVTGARPGFTSKTETSNPTAFVTN
jgi:hypothetical protein